MKELCMELYITSQEQANLLHQSYAVNDDLSSISQIWDKKTMCKMQWSYDLIEAH